MLFAIGLTYSIISAMAALFFLWRALDLKDEKMFILSIFFTFVSWSGIEWSLWLLGYNLFELVLEPIVPLASFFLIWSIAFIYLAEVWFKRRDAMLFIGSLLIIFIIARACMDCL